MTIGILLPALVLGQFGLLEVGLVLSVGALCVSGTDNAGPIHHRRTGMVVCIAALFVVSLAVGFTSHSHLLIGIILFVFCFFFSMLGVYGIRASSIGVAALLVSGGEAVRHPATSPKARARAKTRRPWRSSRLQADRTGHLLLREQRSLGFGSNQARTDVPRAESPRLLPAPAIVTLGHAFDSLFLLVPGVAASSVIERFPPVLRGPGPETG